MKKTKLVLTEEQKITALQNIKNLADTLQSPIGNNKKEKTEAQKANDKNIEETIFLFKDLNAGIAKLYGNKTERKWALHLYSKYGDKVKAMVAFIPTYNKGLKNKWGTVIKPSQLVEHLQDVINAKKKLDAEIRYQLNKEENERKDKEDERKRKELEDQYTKEEKERMRKIRNDNMRKAMGFN